MDDLDRDPVGSRRWKGTLGLVRTTGTLCSILPGRDSR